MTVRNMNFFSCFSLCVHEKVLVISNSGLLMGVVIGTLALGSLDV